MGGSQNLSFWNRKQKKKARINVWISFLASFNLLRLSPLGLSFPNSLKTSFRSLSCHSGYTLSKNTVHVSRSAVVSWPAKKNVLHSCMISSMLKLICCCLPPCSVGMQASSIKPSRSFPYRLPSDPNRDWMIWRSVPLSFLSSFHFRLLLVVGR